MKNDMVVNIWGPAAQCHYMDVLSVPLGACSVGSRRNEAFGEGGLSSKKRHNRSNSIYSWKCAIELHFTNIREKISMGYSERNVINTEILVITTEM